MSPGEPTGPLDELDEWARSLLDRQRVGRLSFVDDEDGPRVLPVTYAWTGSALVTAIDAKPKRSREPARVRYLRRRPRAALVADHYSDDWSQLAWVQVLGRVEVREAAQASAELEALAAKYEPYRRQAPAGPLLILRPERALSWRASGG